MIPVIIPYYKNRNQLAKCISHLSDQTVPVELFVRDNNQDNVYFTAAINEGIKKYLEQSCQYILMLNQDMYLECNAVEKMVEFMDSHPRCGIGAPLQLHSRDPNFVVFAGGWEAFPMGKHEYGDVKDFTEDKQIPWANGACMILRKEMIREIGLLDENLLFIGSDSDYCFTARSRGWQVWRITGARGIHDQGASGSICNSNIERMKIKDMIYFGRKWLTGDLYRELASEGEALNPETTNTIMNELQQTLIELESTLNPTPLMNHIEEIIERAT
jgi:GT2 family glycosyltransferase